MIDTEVAGTLGIERAEAEDLLNGGHASENIAQALGVPLACIQPYLDTGSVPDILAERLDVPAAAFEEFSVRLTKRGRTGLIFGMLLPH